MLTTFKCFNRQLVQGLLLLLPGFRVVVRVADSSLTASLQANEFSVFSYVLLVFYVP